MSSTISIVQNTGEDYSGATQEVAKNIFYFLTEADATADKATYPLQIPDAGTVYSYEVYLRCRCDLAPAVRCDNFKAWYNSGMPVAGFVITVNSDIVNVYAAPVDMLSAKGTRVDFTTKNAVGNSIALDGTLENVLDYTSYLCCQLEVDSTAETGNSEVNFSIQFDEV